MTNKTYKITYLVKMEAKAKDIEEAKELIAHYKKIFPQYKDYKIMEVVETVNEIKYE